MTLPLVMSAPVSAAARRSAAGVGEQVSLESDFGESERDISAMAHDLGTNLDELVAQLVSDQCSTLGAEDGVSALGSVASFGWLASQAANRPAKPASDAFGSAVRVDFDGCGGRERWAEESDAGDELAPAFNIH